MTERLSVRGRWLVADRDTVIEHLDAAKARLHEAVSAAIRRKKVPELVFDVLVPVDAGET